MKPEYRTHSHLIAGHGHCRIIGWGQRGGPFTPEPLHYPQESGLGWWVQLEFQDGFIATQHEDMIEPLWQRYPASFFPPDSEDHRLATQRQEMFVRGLMKLGKMSREVAEAEMGGLHASVQKLDQRTS